MATAVIGLGNPILSDDGVGIRTLRLLKDLIPPSEDVVLKEAHVGGLSLMEELVGFDRAVIIDAMVTGTCRPGTIRALELTEFAGTRNLVSSHDTNLWMALRIGREVGLRLPGDVRVIGIEAAEAETFGEGLSEAVEKAARVAAAAIGGDLFGGADRSARERDQ